MMKSRHADPVKRKNLVIVLLTLAVLNTVWIITQAMNSVTDTESYLAVSGVVVLSLVMLILGGGLLLRRPWSLFPLSLLGKFYFIFVLLLFLIRSQDFLTVTWLLTAEAIVYLSIMNYLNPLRVFVGRDPVSPGFIGGRAAATILFFVTLVTLYSVYIGYLFPEFVYRINSQKYEDHVLRSGTGEDPAYAWSDRWRVAVPDYLLPLDRDIGIGIWSNPRKEKLIVTERVWTEQILEYSFLGFKDSYHLEKALWDAGITRPFLLPMKMTMADEGTRVYYLENPGVNAIVVIKQAETASGQIWVVTSNLYPGSTPYNIESISPSLDRALIPVRMTLERYRK